MEAPNPASVANDHFQIIVAALAAVLVALVPVFILLIKTYGKTGRIRDQVENDHPTNLREEADERHDENGRKLDRILDSIVLLRADVSTLFKADQAQDDQIAQLEKTINPHDKDTPWQPSPPSSARTPKHSWPSSEQASPPPSGSSHPTPTSGASSRFSPP